jgi:hypothetical protein
VILFWIDIPISERRKTTLAKKNLKQKRKMILTDLFRFTIKKTKLNFKAKKTYFNRKLTRFLG